MKFLRITKAQGYFVLHKKSFWISFYIMLFFSVVGYLNVVRQGMQVDVYNMKRASDLFALHSYSEIIQYFILLFPLIISFPMAFSGFDEEQGKSATWGIVRSNRWLYFGSKCFVSFLAGAILILVPFGLNLLWNAITFMDNGNSWDGLIYSQLYFSDNEIDFENLYKLHPYGYRLYYLLHLSGFAGICSMFAYAVSNYIKKYKIFVVLPVYVVFFVSNQLQIEGFCMDDYLLSPLQKKDFCPMLIVEGVLLILSVIVMTNYIRKKEIL